MSRIQSWIEMHRGLVVIICWKVLLLETVSRTQSLIGMLECSDIWWLLFVEKDCNLKRTGGAYNGMIKR